MKKQELVKMYNQNCKRIAETRIESEKERLEKDNQLILKDIEKIENNK